MTLAEYNELIKTEPEFIETPTKELMEEWLDEKIAVQREINDILKKHKGYLEWGDFNEDAGEFANEVQICGQYGDSDYMVKMHIYKGIDKIAKILGRELSERPRNDSEIPWEYFFKYKGYELFEISRVRFSGFGDEK